MDQLIKSAEALAMFCRLNLNLKRDLPIRSSEMGLLILVCKSEEPITPVKAAEFFQVKKPMITAMVTNLEKKGYLLKEPVLSDKRSVVLVGSSAAKALVDAAFDEYIKVIGVLKSSLGEHQFNEMIRLIDLANLELRRIKIDG